MEIYHALKWDLIHYFKYERKKLICILSRKPIPKQTELQIRLEKMFSKFKPLIYQILLSDNKSNNKSICYKLNGRHIYFNYNIKIQDFIEFILINKVTKIHLSRLNHCYKSFQECRGLFLKFKLEDFVLKCNPRCYQYMRQILVRYRANINCAERDESVENVTVIIEIKE